MATRLLLVPIAASLAAALVLAGCAGAAVSSSTSAPITSPAPTVPVPDSPVTGVVIAVDSAGLSKVSGFTIRLADGTELALSIGELENGAEFPPGHLSEHMVSAEPVRAFFRPEGDALVVYRIEDAGKP